MLARRRHWHIERGNDGKARVLVEEAELVVRPLGRPPEQPSQDDRAESALLVEFKAQIAELKREREELYVAGDNLTTENAGLRERAARAEGKAETLERALADLAERLDQATEELRELHRPWWRRLIG